MMSSLFQSFFLGGFECSAHRLRSGKRLDLLAATQHHSYQQIYADYRGLQQQGIFTARSGIRWHLIETRPYHYDFSSVLPALQAAQATGVQILWDLCHFGWPDNLDIFAAEFVRRFASFAAAFAHLLANELETIPFLVPMNEISFFAWAGGDVAYLNPFARGCGLELKRQLVRATIAATEAIWAVLPQARILHVDPVINILPDPRRPHEGVLAEQYRLSQYQAWDTLAGRECPELGGQEKYLDIIGVNYYERNQWIHDATFLTPLHPLYKPFRHILREVYDRYRRPLFIAETGAEDEVRPAWLKYIGSEVRAVMRAGVPIEGICLYPILNHPGWDDERHCCNGLWDYADEEGQRELYIPLARELQCQQRLFKQLCARSIHRRITVAHTATRGPVPHKKPSLCLFTDSREPWGLGEQMLTLAAELLNRYRILFVCPPTLRGEHLLACALALGCTPFALNLQDERTAYRALKARLRRMQVEIFHVQAGSSGEGHQGVDIARCGGVPVVIRTEHLPSCSRTLASRRPIMPCCQPSIRSSVSRKRSSRATGQQASRPQSWPSGALASTSTK